MKASTSHRLQTVVLTAVLAVLGASGIGASQVHAHPDVDSVFTNGTDVADVASAKVYTTYFIDWGIYGRKYMPDMIPIDKITHLNYAFANVADDGKLVMGDSYAAIDKAYPGDVWDTTAQPFRGNFWQINVVLKKKNPNFKSLISVGGWTWSGKFSKVAASASGRANFAASCAEWVTKYGFDGIDLDWEYPGGGGLPGNSESPADGKNYVLLIEEIRKSLDALGKGHLLITVAGGAGPDKVANLDIPGLARTLDFYNIMTYDFRGGWSKYTGHQTPLYAAGAMKPPADDPDAALTDTAAVVQNYIKRGFPANKLCIGAAFYGRGWKGVGSGNNGLYQTHGGVPTGSWDDGTSGATGVFDYKAVKAKIASGELKRFYDSGVQAPWAFSPTSGVMISYDDAESIKAKCAFVNQMGLAGVMTWDLTGDDNSELTNAIVSNLGGITNPGPKPVPTFQPPSPPLPTGSSSSVPKPTSAPPPPMPGNCPVAGTPCKPPKDGQMCVANNVAKCTRGTKNFWLFVPCASGYVCKQTKKGQAYCDIPRATDQPLPCQPGGSLPPSPPIPQPTNSPQPAPSPCPGAPVPGSPCSETQARCASSTMYATCLYGTWVTQPCAAGTVCKNVASGGFVCDFAGFRVSEQVCYNGLRLLESLDQLLLEEDEALETFDGDFPSIPGGELPEDDDAAASAPVPDSESVSPIEQQNVDALRDSPIGTPVPEDKTVITATAIATSVGIVAIGLALTVYLMKKGSKTSALTSRYVAVASDEQIDADVRNIFTVK